MTPVRALLARLRGLLVRRRLDADLQQEIASHLDEAIDEYRHQGLSPPEARRAALRSFGGVTQAIEIHRDARGWPALESLVRDLRRAVRLLRRSPAVTTAAILSLALGMGGTTTMFSLMNGLMLRPLPVVEPDRLVSIATSDGNGAWRLQVWEQLRDRDDLFDGLFAWSARSIELAERGESRQVSALLVSGGFFEVLGLDAQRGRLLRQSDDDAGGGQDGPVAVVSDSYWRRQLGADPEIVGQRLSVGSTPLTIVGVGPASFLGPEVGQAFDVAVPMAVAPLLQPDRLPEDVLGNLWLSIMARLRPSHDASTATTALRTAMPALLEAADASVPSRARLRGSMRESVLGVHAVPAPGGLSALREQYDRAVITVTAIAIVVLLIACVNLANLFLARGAARRRELAIAVALGASRGRLVRQLVIEGLVLAAVGATAGLLIAVWASPLVIRELPTFGRTAVDLPIDWRLLSFTGLTAVVTALLFSAAPALRVTRPGTTSMLPGARLAGTDVRETRLHGWLVSLQFGLSMLLTISAALLVATFIRLERYDLGFDPDAVQMLNVSLKGGNGDFSDESPRNRRILEGVRALPEVSAAAFGNVPLLTQGRMTMMLKPGDTPGLSAEQEVFEIEVTPGWFETMDVPIRLGRDLSWSDTPQSTMVINETLARMLFPGRSPIGARLHGSEVVGVVADAVYRSAREGTPPTAYSIGRMTFGTLSVRPVPGAPASPSRIVEAILQIDPDVVVRTTPLSAHARMTLATERVTAMLAGFFGLLALVLAAVGTYGVMAYTVSRRRTELAIRRALGATASMLMTHVVGRGLKLVVGGVVLGATVSFWVGTLLSPMLYGVGPRDLPTLAGATIVLMAVALVAIWLPSRRAARLNPAILLRQD